MAMRWNFNYKKGLVWTAQCSETPPLDTTISSAEGAQEDIDKDIPRAKLYPKNTFSNDTRQYFVNGWNSIREPFCYLQGDMLGGVFIKIIWDVLVAKDFAFAARDDLSFGYVDDDNKRRGLMLMYHTEDPSKWMLCITKDTEKVSLKQRKVAVFVSSYFREKFKEKNDGKNIGEKNLSKEVAKVLNSESLEPFFKAFFTPNIHVDVEKVREFEGNQIAFLGDSYVIEPMNKPLPLIPISTRNYFPDMLGGALGASAGFLFGAYILGPMFAVPTMGLSLVFAPLFCALIGAAIGLIIGSGISQCFYKGSKSQPPSIRFEEPFPPLGGSQKRMAKYGLRHDPASETVTLPHGRGSIEHNQQLSNLSQGCSSLPASTCKVT